MKRVKQLQQHFPLSLTSDELLVNCAWEAVRGWSRDLESVEKLDFAVECLQLVENGYLLNGVCFVLWQSHVLPKLRDIVYVYGKVGKAAKDRICRRELEMSEAGVGCFILFSKKFLDLFLQANCGMEKSLIPVAEVEQLWMDGNGGQSHKASLLEVAIRQEQPLYHMIKHHYYLALIMETINVLGVGCVVFAGSRKYFTPSSGQNPANEAIRFERQRRLLRRFRPQSSPLNHRTAR